MPQPRQIQQGLCIAAQEHGADINDDFVDQTRFDHGAAQRRAGLQQHLVATVLFRQALHGRPQIHTSTLLRGDFAHARTTAGKALCMLAVRAARQHQGISSQRQ